MATKQIEGTTIDVTPDDVSELENDIDADLSSIFAEFGGAPDDKAFKVKVYRVIPDKGEMSWLFDCFPSELPINARLRDEYGGGLFEMRIYEMRGGKYTLKKKPHISIEAPRKIAAPGSGDIANVLREMREQNAQMFAQLSEVMKKSSGVMDIPSNPISMFKEMAVAMAAMRELMPQPQQINPMEMVSSIVQLAGSIKGEGGGGETNMMDVLKEIISSPMIGGLLQNASVAKQPAQLAAPAQPTAQSEQDQMSIIQQQVKGYIDMLVLRASQGKNPELAADLLLEDLPESIIREHLLKPTAIDDAAKINPEVSKYRPWFERLQATLTGFLAGDN